MRSSKDIILTLFLTINTLSSPVFRRRDPNENIDPIQNDIISHTCKPLTILYARGTHEPENFGDHYTPGAFLANALYDKLGQDKVALQGLDKKVYPARKVGNWTNLAVDVHFAGYGMRLLGETLRVNCPESKLSLVGYSQGAMVVHAALLSKTNGSDFDEWVSSAVVFGDPVENYGFGLAENKTESFCHKGDRYCHEAHVVGDGHDDYGEHNAVAAADFVLQKAGL